MKETKYYKLNKPDLNDYVDVQDLNDNFDTIDGVLNTGANNNAELRAQLDEHDQKITSKEGRHGFRYVDGKLEIDVDGVWQEFRSGTEFKLGNVENMKAKALAGRKIEVSFGDPENSIVIDENGDEVILAERAGTMLRAKRNSYPVDENDGQLLDDYKEKNKYKDTPFLFEDLNDGDEWFFMAFPYTNKEVFTVDSANRAKATATTKRDQPAPAAPSVSELDFDRAKVTGGDLVSLDGNTWHDSPHLFTGLTEETTYIAYAKYKETDEFLESPVSPGKTFTTPRDTPGPSVLKGGSMQAGYFGVVPANELFTGSEITSAVGITQGTAQFNNVGWLKFAIDGKIIYKSQKPYRYGISWDHINSKGVVDGTKTVTKDGTTYRVRLMKGLRENKPGSHDGVSSHGSEWNKLMLPIHERARDQSWNYSSNVNTPTEDWGVGFTDKDLHTNYEHGDGTYQWCQEVNPKNASLRVTRGSVGVSLAGTFRSSSSTSFDGWSPVLEVVQ